MLSKKFLWVTLLASVESLSYAMNGQEQPAEQESRSSSPVKRVSSPGLAVILAEGQKQLGSSSAGQQKFSNQDDKEYVEVHGSSNQQPPAYQFGSPTWSSRAPQPNQHSHRAFQFGLSINVEPHNTRYQQEQQPNSMQPTLDLEPSSPRSNAELVIIQRELKEQREQEASHYQELNERIGQVESTMVAENAKVCAMIANLHNYNHSRLGKIEWKLDQIMRVYYPQMFEPQLQQTQEHQGNPFQSRKLRAHAHAFQPKDDQKNDQTKQ